MPYKPGNRLPGERASKLGHLDVIKSELVNRLIDEFEHDEGEAEVEPLVWEEFGEEATPLRLIFAVDGSMQPIVSTTPPYKELSFVKTSLIRLDQVAISRVDQKAPHPLQLRDILADSAIYHATVFPMRAVSIPGLSNYDAVRRIIFESMQDESIDAQSFKTLKWLAYEKWTGKPTQSPNFECPHCRKDVGGLPPDANTGPCPHCKGELYLTDMLGFHLEMGEDAVPQTVATAYMLVHETLFLFTGIRHFWEAKKQKVLEECLFLKDGPLTLRSQYSKLVIPIRRFFQYSQEHGITIHMAGQEKTGAFVDHLEKIGKHAPPKTVFLPSNDYIRREVQSAPERAEPYGIRTNYGNKLFVKTDPHHKMVISIPTGEYKDSKELTDLIGINRILATLPTIKSHRHEGALLPIQLANGVASLSTYPSAAVLKMFAGI